MCKSYYDCYVEAGKRVAGECKDNKECKELRTLELLLDCFEKLASAWNARWWECEAYKASLVCAQKLQQKSDNKCSGKIGAYLYSAQQSIKKYCEPEKSPSSAPGKPSVGEKAKPDKPDAPLKELFQQRTEPCSSTERQSDVLEVR